MKKCTLIFMLILAACGEDDVTHKGFSDPNWLKLEIPGAREAYAITGNIEDTLLVATLTKAFYTVDEGKTWIESYDFHGPVIAFLDRNDTIFSLESRVFDPQGFEYASSARHFTRDAGKTWNYYARNQQLKQRIGTTSSSSGTEYFLKRNTTPVSAGSSTSYVNPTDVLKRSRTTTHSIDFPYKHNIMNLHMDANNRLYIAASGGLYQETTNTFLCCDDTMPAVIYVSKKPFD